MQKVTIYTDGACSGNPGPGGWGIVIISKNGEQQLSGGEKLTTNNRMELMAAISALKHIYSDENMRLQNISVYIDSQYVKNGITSWIASWKRNGWKTASKAPVKNQDLWIILDELNTKLNVNWVWVKGHAGFKYNEICDKLATDQVKLLS